jgi:cell division septation protein DedD
VIVPKAMEVKPAPVAVPPKQETPRPVKVASAAPVPADENIPIIKATPIPPPSKPKPIMVIPKDEPEDDADDNADDTATDKPAARSSSAPATAASSGADYEVQLGSYRETADAKKDWNKFQNKYAAYLGKLKMRLVRADVPGKGTYYRLRAGTISKDRAHEICDALKADHGVGCILAKR